MTRPLCMWSRDAFVFRRRSIGLLVRCTCVIQYDTIRPKADLQPASTCGTESEKKQRVMKKTKNKLKTKTERLIRNEFQSMFHGGGTSNDITNWWQGGPKAAHYRYTISSQLFSNDAPRDNNRVHVYKLKQFNSIHTGTLFIPCERFLRLLLVTEYAV